MKNPKTQKKILYQKEFSRFKFEHYIRPEYNYTTKNELVITGYSGTNKHDDQRMKEKKEDLYDLLYNRCLSFFYANGYLTKTRKSIIYYLDNDLMPRKIAEVSLDFLETEGRPFLITDLAYKNFGTKETDNKRLEAIFYSIYEKCKKYLGIDPANYTVKRDRSEKTIEQLLDIKLKFRDRKHLIDYCSKLVETNKVERSLVEKFYFQVEKFY